MKKLFSICAVLLFILLASCGTKPVQEEKPPVSTTLMIYMVGSDLEAKTGAASSDLEEIAASGIDLAHNRVVVCAGASPYWVNEAVNPEQLNILTLQEQGFAVTDTLEGASMGTAQQLQRFLTYCHSQYAGDEFALILWDHGNGPVMGYGKDILYGNDALLLAEIRQALENSPFGETEKLSWMGFDACLMASAELSCLLADYADYLIASQEVEPAFGWDYSFLSQLGKTDSLQLLTLATQKYMAACDAYYTERNYSNYDVTLSVVDLSLAGELDQAINDLFSRAEGEVTHYYDLLAKNRVQSKALGRATTGSEYDLVDLQDMASQLSSQYPQQSAALQDVISRMVVVNATSMEHCCGMSLYYPFYNKRYYEKDWKQIYGELDLFPEYLAYLTGYEQVWLREDRLDSMAAGLTPEQLAEHTFQVTLDPSQAASVADVQFHVLERLEGDIYRPLYSSQDVIRQDNALIANYDGMGIYVNAGEDNRFILSLTAIDRIDMLSRYSGILTLSNVAYQPENLTDEALPEDATSVWRYLLTLNRETGKAEISGTVPYDEAASKDLIQAGRLEDAPMDFYGLHEFYRFSSRYITRYKNGVIKPLDQWYDTGFIVWDTAKQTQGYSFEYAPLANGEYYLTFEIADTQGGRYCTELLPIIVEHDVPEKTPLPVSQVKWQPGENRVLLKERDGVRIYLTIQDTEDGTFYFVDAENFNDAPVTVYLQDAVINGTMQTTSSTYMDVYPHDFMYEELRFGRVEGSGLLEQLQSLQFTVWLEHGRSGRSLWSKEIVQIDMTQAPAAEGHADYGDDFRFEKPVLGALAEKQVLCETQDMRITLMGIGLPAEASDQQEANCLFLVENLSEQDLQIGLEGIEVNGWFVHESNNAFVAAGNQTFLSVSLGESSLKPMGFDGIETLSFLFSASEEGLRWIHDAPCIWCPVTLTQTAGGQTGPKGTLLWERDGVRVFLQKFDPMNARWPIIIENNTQQDISVALVDARWDSNPDGSGWSIYLSDGQVGPGQSVLSKIWISDWGADASLPVPKEISFRLQVLNFYETQVLFDSDEVFTIPVK